jgi:hypothetical protein
MWIVSSEAQNSKHFASRTRTDLEMKMNTNDLQVEKDRDVIRLMTGQGESLKMRPGFRFPFQ